MRTRSHDAGLRPVAMKLGVVWLALLVLLSATLALAYVPLGRDQLAVALGIAALKCLLVACFFMDLVRSPPLLRLAASTALLWLALLFVLVLADLATRS